MGMILVLASSKALLLLGCKTWSMPPGLPAQQESKLSITWICRDQQDLVCLLSSFGNVMVSIGLSSPCS